MNKHTWDRIHNIILNNEKLRNLPEDIITEIANEMEEIIIENEYFKREWEEADGLADVMSADLRDARREIDELKDELEQVYTERDEAWTRLAEIEMNAE